MSLSKAAHLHLALLAGSFALLISLSTAQRPKKVFAHYLPWYDSAGINYPFRTGWCYPDGGNYDCNDISVIHYSNKPLIGEYTQFQTDVLEYHFLLMHATALDGIIININPANPLQRDASLFILDYLLTFNAKYPSINLQVIVSYDDQGGKTQSEITTLLTWVHTNIYNNPTYSSLIFHDPVTAHPVLLAWSETDNEHYWNTAQSLFSSQVFFAIRNPRLFQFSDANFEWVNFLNTGLPKTNTANWGQQFFENMDYVMARQSTDSAIAPADVNTVKIGGVYPGFDDENVPPFWNGGTNRYILRTVDDGDTLSLTWQLQIDYTPLRLGGVDSVENPWIQIATWNDWPEGTSIEPATSDTYGYTALETCRVKTAEFKGFSPPFASACLGVPFLVYEKRKAGDSERADYGIEQLLLGNCLASLDTVSPSPTPSNSPPVLTLSVPPAVREPPAVPPAAAPTSAAEPILTPSSAPPSPSTRASPTPSATPRASSPPSPSPSSSLSPTSSISPSPTSSPSPSPSTSPVQCACRCSSLFRFPQQLFANACGAFLAELQQIEGSAAVSGEGCRLRVEQLCTQYEELLPAGAFRAYEDDTSI
eukprot:GFKZ01008139.1.p1 GENE.GFKZ01008139.1~~GFKZ01008139.1.p1  ORF type:complete len:593 (-),score=49.67 GFKZ01008139.1:525-2303(-)